MDSGSNAYGIGFIQGYMRNATFHGTDSFLRSDGYIMLALYPDAIIDGGTARGNAWLEGSIFGGGLADLQSSSYFHSGIRGGAQIVTGGFANGYSYVEAGQLSFSISNRIFNGFRNPSTMPTQDWIDGKPWPDPLP